MHLVLAGLLTLAVLTTLAGVVISLAFAGYIAMLAGLWPVTMIVWGALTTVMITGLANVYLNND